jgi:hypothetical protein
VAFFAAGLVAARVAVAVLVAAFAAGFAAAVFFTVLVGFFATVDRAAGFRAVAIHRTSR